MSFNVCVVITLYDPDIIDKTKILSLSKLCKLIYIHDNTESKKPYQHELSDMEDNIIYERDLCNDGVATALNIGCSIAVKNNCTHVLFFDQDSNLSIEDVNLYLMAISKRQDLNEVAVYSPNIICDYVNEKKYINKTKEEVRDWLITSGSLINLSIYSQTKGFDENLFIDFVDIDYCLTVSNLGYQLIQLPFPIMRHNLGDIKYVMRYKIYQHSPLRNYYMFRNRIYLNDKFHRSKFSIILIIKSCKQLFKIIMLEDMKIRKLKATYLGYKDFKEGQMGECLHSI